MTERPRRSVCPAKPTKLPNVPPPPPGDLRGRWYAEKLREAERETWIGRMEEVRAAWRELLDTLKEELALRMLDRAMRMLRKLRRRR